MKRKGIFFGGPSLLVSFLLVLLTMLALLSLTQARADHRLSREAAQRTVEFYEGERKAVEIAARLRKGEAVPGVTLEQGVYFYSCPVSEFRTLYAELEEGTFRVLRWQIVSHPEAPNENLSLWQG